MADVFISYKRQERARCERIAKKLRALGLDVWFDAHLESGKSFDKEIEDTIAKSKAVLVLWSPDSVQSRWVRDEAGFAFKKEKLVAATLAPCELPIAFSSIHFEELHDPQFQDDNPAWLKVIGRIGELVGRPSITSYSQALAQAAVPLEKWAREHPTDPLARQIKAKADALGGAEPAPVAAAAPQRTGAGVGVLVGVALVALLAGAGAGYFGARMISPTQPSLPQERVSVEVAAAQLTGAWGFVPESASAPDCETLRFDFWLGGGGAGALTLTITERGEGGAIGPVLSRQTITGVGEDGVLRATAPEGDITYQLTPAAEGQPARLRAASGETTYVYGACT